MTKKVERLSGPLQAERLISGRRKLLRTLSVRVEQHLIHVPAGTDTDYTSAPFFVRPFVHWSRVDVAGVVHDHLYQTGTLSRAKADRIWRLLTRVEKHRANFIQAWCGWLMLRLWGWLPWRRYRRATQASLSVSD